MKSLRVKGASPEAVADRIRVSAKKIGVRRIKLATELARIAGVTPTAAHKWLNGTSSPSKSNADKIAAALGVTAHYLLFGDDSAQVETEPMAFELMKIQQSYRNGRLTQDDLVMIERFAELLASKNQQNTAAGHA